MQALVIWLLALLMYTLYLTEALPEILLLSVQSTPSFTLLYAFLSKRPNPFQYTPKPSLLNHSFLYLCDI